MFTILSTRVLASQSKEDQVVDILMVVAVGTGRANRRRSPAARTLAHPREEGVNVSATAHGPRAKRVGATASLLFP